ncbi:uncharacterized protein LOC129730770 [Wyeomyia smithii]|uniref:uncharacterized protein LOC129730770 n=1 Tax=Wyeomyia smithii TaxID=174621 RepID=UPI002467EB6D|nr:uncharacterized protein LOC129730770 [Wyeomyia smithii]
MDEEMKTTFKDFYEEIDRLCYFPVKCSSFEPVVERNVVDSVPADVIKETDVDELIEYSKKFVEKIKSDIRKDLKRFDEQAVQCSRTENKRNKKLNTPPKWTANRQKQKQVAETNRATAIRIIKRIPMNVSAKDETSIKGLEQNQLNNQKPAQQVKQVRNIGTNVNIIIPSKASKRQNLLSVESVPSVAQSLPIIKKTVTPQTAVKSFRFYNSKLSPVQIWEQQHPELGLQNSTNSLFPKRVRKSDMEDSRTQDSKTKNLPEEPRDTEGKKIVHFTNEIASTPEDCTIQNSNHSQPKEQNLVSAVVEPEFHKSSTITKHVIPTISIKGDWKANLQIQEICRINILDEKPVETHINNPSNLKYLEIRHESCVTKHTTKANDNSDKTTDNCVPPESSTAVKPSSFKPLIIVPKSTLKENTFSHSNKYLRPFANIGKQDGLPKSNLFDSFIDSETSSEENENPIIVESDTSESSAPNGIENLDLTFHRHSTPTRFPSSLSAVPRLSSPIKSQSHLQSRSVQTVPTIVAPSSPQMQPEIVEPDGVPSMSPPEAVGSSKFLENLQIWKSAVSAQSENMKLGNQLSNDLEKLKQNMATIADESQNIAKITRTCEESLKQINQLKDRHVENRPPTALSSVPFGTHFGHSSPANILGSMEETVHDHKQFQRAVFQQSPKYSKVIKKICDDGRHQRFKKSTDLSDIAVERAARKFLDSCQRSISSLSFNELTTSRSHSPESNHSWNDTFQSSSGSFSENTTGVSSSAKRSRSSSGRIEGTFNSSCSDGQLIPATSTRIGVSSSDEGEVLSLGEVK